MSPPLRQRLLTWAGRIGANPTDTSETKLQKRLTVALTLGPAPVALLWGIVYIAAGAHLGGAIPVAYCFVAIANTALFAFTRNLPLFRFSQLLMILVLPWLMTIILGGFTDSSAVIIWSVLSPLAALLLGELRRSLYWLLAFLGLLVVTGVTQPYLPPGPLPGPLVTWFFVFNLGAVITIGFVLLYHFVGQRNFFQAQSEGLLLNILPTEISEILKTEPHTIAARHDAVSILFADVVGFTPMAATMTSSQLVDLLNEVFELFDDLVEKHGLEKIKTIGDCYMVAAGVPTTRTDHAEAIVRLALDMREAVAAAVFSGHRLSFRFGVNSGWVVAGVIGRKKFTYDLWGDAVNLASRMESQGQSGVIQIARGTYELVKDTFQCEPKGTVQVKGAGEIEVWHVRGLMSA